MGSTICIKCGSSIDPFSYCELCKEPLNFKCSSCGFVTEEKVHADCMNANSLVTENESIDKSDSLNSAAKSQDPMQRDTELSNKSSAIHDVKAIDMEIFDSESYPSDTILDIIGKSWNSFASLNADIFSSSNRLSSLYYEQFLQYEKAWGYYWTETYRLINTLFSESPKTNTIQ
jgi:hypothetical protein